MGKRKNIFAVGVGDESFALLDILDNDFLVATATSLTQRAAALTLMKTATFGPVHSQSAQTRPRRSVGVYMRTSFRGDI